MNYLNLTKDKIEQRLSSFEDMREKEVKCQVVKYARYCYVYERMPEYAKRKGSVLNQHGITVEAEREFQAFMNSCFISCSLPREERDPLKWDKKNIGRYFSL